MSKPIDKLAIELVSRPPNATRSPGPGTVFDRFTSVQITNDMLAPSEASFEVGDDGSWPDLKRYVAHGARYRVSINGKTRLTGRVEMNDIPVDARGGAVVRFTVRTKLQDAVYASAKEDVVVKGVSILEFLLQLYAPLGYGKSDFVVRTSLSRDLMTGRGSTNKGAETEKNLEPIKLKEAKINPPETIYDAADRHLRRHGLMHWDSPDGKIVVGAPNDAQPPLYQLVTKRTGGGIGNNILGCTRTQDWSGIPSKLGLYGVGGGRGTARARVSTTIQDDDVVAAGFYRPVTVIAEAVKTRELADRAAARELSARRKLKDSFDIEVDGLSWWSGSAAIPWGVDTVAEITTDVAGGTVGAYHIYRVVSKRDASSGDVTNLTLVRKGIWIL